jgi:hypothetical protein
MLRRALATALAAVVIVPLATSCKTSGIDEAIYTSPDQDGARHQNVFFTDSKAIFVIAKYVTGRTDLSGRTFVTVFNVYNDAVTFPPILIDDSQLHKTSGSGAQVYAVQFPDPPQIQKPNPADPNNPITETPPRATGRFRFTVEIGDEKQTTDFVVLQGANGTNPDPTVPPPGNCVSVDDEGKCPKPTDLHAVACCNPRTKSCGTGVEGTGLCF